MELEHWWHHYYRRHRGLAGAQRAAARDSTQHTDTEAAGDVPHARHYVIGDASIVTVTWTVDAYQFHADTEPSSAVPKAKHR